MDFLGFMGVPVIYLTEYLIQSYIALQPSPAITASGCIAYSGGGLAYITIPPSTTKTCPVM
jgi:hypothetical protein